MAKGYFAFLV